MQLRRVTVDAGARSPDGRVNAYVLGEHDGVLVDPGGFSPELADAVDEASVRDVLVTHFHPDHVNAVDRFAGETTVWARAGREDAFERASGVTPDRTFRPGTTLNVETGPIHVLDTPGHVPEHVAFETPAGILCGDLAVADGSIVVGAPEGDMRAYLSSLRRLYARNPTTMWPSHGPEIHNPRATLQRLISHRLDREQRILRAVQRGARTLDEILDAAYEKDLSGVEDLARATVVAHLEKLAVESSVSWNGERAVA